MFADKESVVKNELLNVLSTSICCQLHKTTCQFKRKSYVMISGFISYSMLYDILNQSLQVIHRPHDLFFANFIAVIHLYSELQKVSLSPFS